MVFAQKRLRDGVGKTQRGNRFCGDRTLGALFIYHDPDDFDIVQQIDLLQHLLAIGHLWDGFRRNKAHSIDVLEVRLDQRAQVTRLQFRGDLPLETLPRITRALDQLDSIVNHGNGGAYLKNSLARSKKLLRIGAFSSPQSAANSSSFWRCSAFKRDGTSTIRRANKSP